MLLGIWNATWSRVWSKKEKKVGFIWSKVWSIKTTATLEIYTIYVTLTINEEFFMNHLPLTSLTIHSGCARLAIAKISATRNKMPETAVSLSMLRTIRWYYMKHERKIQKEVNGETVMLCVNSINKTKCIFALILRQPSWIVNC